VDNKYLSRVADRCGTGSAHAGRCSWFYIPFFPFSGWALMCTRNTISVH